VNLAAINNALYAFADFCFEIFYSHYRSREAFTDTKLFGLQHNR
jgi:hypothetical protein